MPSHLNEMAEAQFIIPLGMITGEQREPMLDFSEFGWSELIHGYVWDADKRQHVVLSTSMYKNPNLPIEGNEHPDYWGSEYHISYFSSDGTLQKTYRTGVYRFEGKFVYCLPGFRSLGGGRTTLYRMDNQRGDDNAGSYVFDPETGKLENYFNSDYTSYRDRALDLSNSGASIILAENSENLLRSGGSAGICVPNGSAVVFPALACLQFTEAKMLRASAVGTQEARATST